MASFRHIDVNYNAGKDRDVTVISFVDRTILDEANILAIAEELFKLLEELYRGKIVLNFSRVEVMSTVVLGTLIKVEKRAKENGARLKLCNIRPQIQKVFEITKLNKLFDIQRDEAAALVSF